MVNQIFSGKSIVKYLLMAISCFFWIYFLISSKLTMHSIIVFDLFSLFNAMNTINFILFLIFLPLTSIIVLSVILNSKKKDSITYVTIGLALPIIIASIIFRLNIYFILFLGMYILAHALFCFIVTKESKLTLYNYSTECLSKLTVFIIIAVLISTIIFILPNQREKAEEFQVGLVNMFIAEDIDPWIDTSYAISRQCTSSNLKYIMSSNEYLALSNQTDQVSINFTDFMSNLRKDMESDKSSQDIKKLVPELNTPQVKIKTLDTIKKIPFMSFIENNFALFFGIIFTSLIYSYFSIVFLIFAVAIYLFNSIFKEEKE